MNGTYQFRAKVTNATGSIQSSNSIEIGVNRVDFDGDGSSSSSTSVTLRVSQAYSTTSAFAALRTDGSVVTWGNRASGGLAAVIDGTGKPLSQFPVDFDGDGNPLTTTGPIRVSQIFSSGDAFAALRSYRFGPDEPNADRGAGVGEEPLANRQAKH